MQKELEDWIFWEEDFSFAEANDGFETQALRVPPPGRKSELQDAVMEKDTQVSQMLADAIKRGKNPKNRALEAGRPWNDGDGF